MFIVFIVFCGYLAAARADFYRTSDFLCIWGGGRAVLTHVDPYERASWEAIVGRPTVEANGQVVRICPDRSRSPLWTSALVAPFALVPLESAAVLWAAANIGAALLSCAALWRLARGPRSGAALFAVCVLAGEPFWLLLANAQLGGLVFGAIGLELWLASRGRPGFAGAVLVTLAAKPQLVVVYLPLRLWRALRDGQRPLVGAAFAIGLGLGLITLGLVPGWPREWLVDVLGDRAGIHQRLATAWDLAGTLTGAPIAGLALIIALAGAVVLLVRGRPTSRVEHAALAIAVSLFAAPYAWSYDFLALALPWGVTLANARRTGSGALLQIGVAGSAIASWVLYALAFQRGDESVSAVLPAAAALLTAASIRGARAVG